MGAPKTKEPKGLVVEARLAGIEARIADLDSREPLALLSAQLSRVEAMLLELRQDVPRITACTPQTLKVAEVEKILDDNPHARFIALTPAPGLRPGDSFDSTARFKNRAVFVSNIRGNRLKVALAA